VRSGLRGEWNDSRLRVVHDLDCPLSYRRIGFLLAKLFEQVPRALTLRCEGAVTETKPLKTGERGELPFWPTDWIDSSG
jgi:hypothetical protein